MHDSAGSPSAAANNDATIKIVDETLEAFSDSEIAFGDASNRVLEPATNPKKRKTKSKTTRMAPKRRCFYRGVSPNGGNWKAEISHGGKRFYLGSFACPKEAASKHTFLIIAPSSESVV